MYVYTLIESTDCQDNILIIFPSKDKAIKEMDNLIEESKYMDEPPIYRIETHILKLWD